jgi:hypothetical protein
VIIPQIMPKPDVVALTGGYRKTPFLQIGADIYCDSALICDVLEHRQPTPTLYPKDQKGLARIVAQWADEKLFWAAMAWNFSPKGAAQMFGGSPDAPVEQWGLKAKVFGDDRAKMRVGMPRLPAPDAAAAYRSYLRRLSDMLEGQAFLLGRAQRGRLCRLPPAVVHPHTDQRDGRHPGRHARGAGLDGPHGRDRAWHDGESSALPNPSHSAPVPRRPWPKKNRSGRARHCAGQPGQHHRRELRPRAHRGRADRRHAHALHLAPHRRTRRHRARALSPIGIVGYILKKANP